MDGAIGKNNKVAPYEDIDEDIESRVSLRIQVELILSGNVGRAIDYISIGLSFGTFIIYLVNTYTNTMGWFFDTIDIGILAFFLMEYCINFYSAQHKNLYF